MTNEEGVRELQQIFVDEYKYYLECIILKEELIKELDEYGGTKFTKEGKEHDVRDIPPEDCAELCRVWHIALKEKKTK